MAKMILAAATISTDGNYIAANGHIVGTFVAILVIHGLLNVRLTPRVAFALPS